MQAGAGRKADLDQSLSGVQVFKESRKTTASSLCLLELPLRNSTSAGKTSRHQGTLLSYQCVRAHTYLPAAPEKPGLKQNTLRWKEKPWSLSSFCHVSTFLLQGAFIHFNPPSCFHGRDLCSACHCKRGTNSKSRYRFGLICQPNTHLGFFHYLVHMPNWRSRETTKLALF